MQLARVFVHVSLEFYVMALMPLYVFRVFESPLLAVFVGGKGLTVIADFARDCSQGWVRRTAFRSLLISALRAAVCLARVCSNDEECEDRQYKCNFLHL